MKTQIPADPVSANEKYLVWGLFICFLFIIVIALLPPNVFEWISSLIEASEPVIQG